MTRKTYSPTVGEMLINFVHLNDGREFIENPKDWIRHSSGVIKYIRKLEFEKKRTAYQLMVAVAEFHKTANAALNHDKDVDMSALAKMKSKTTLELRVWAATYYLHKVHSQKNKKIYKKSVAVEIHQKLTESFPKLVPANQAVSSEYWQIPKVSTITTEWLKNI